MVHSFVSIFYLWNRLWNWSEKRKLLTLYIQLLGFPNYPSYQVTTNLQIFLTVNFFQCRLIFRLCRVFLVIFNRWIPCPWQLHSISLAAAFYVLDSRIPYPWLPHSRSLTVAFHILDSRFPFPHYVIYSE